ncbi:MAG: hypothetical protein EBX41_05950 [Chitinophagia bacterium]|nr:hypothetical protein [Chitinophagia bacterium]
MKNNMTLEMDLEASSMVSPLPHSNISHIRYMFHDISRLYVVCKPPSYFLIAKRAIDITVSLAFIVLVMSWLTPILAILIALSSRGPVFFIQRRTGYMGKEFKCFKFRTMYVNPDADMQQVSINDKRITGIGKFLRITHLDETAQFFNVLLGDMSIVGPRPHMLYHTQIYAEYIPYYNLRLDAKPGMTGMAQIKDYIGEINGERELRKRVQWDIYYVKNRTLWLDIKIIATTMLKVVEKAFKLITGKA